MFHGAARLLLEEAGSVGRDREVHLLRRRDEVKLERIEGGIQSRVGSLSSGLQFAITRNLWSQVGCRATARNEIGKHTSIAIGMLAPAWKVLLGAGASTIAKALVKIWPFTRN